VPVLSSSVSWLTLKASLREAADSNFPSDLGAVGTERSTTSTWSPPSTQACRAVRLDEVGDVPGAPAAAGQAEWQNGEDGRRRPVRDADHVHDRAEVLGLAVVHDQQDVPAEVDVLVLEMRQRQGAHDPWISGLRDVEHGDAAPPADVRVVVLEVHPGSASRDVREEMDVARGRERWLDEDVLACGRHRARRGEYSGNRKRSDETFRPAEHPTTGVPRPRAR
jgi:hypothetical protein